MDNACYEAQFWFLWKVLDVYVCNFHVTIITFPSSMSKVWQNFGVEIDFAKTKGTSWDGHLTSSTYLFSLSSILCNFIANSNCEKQ